MRVPAPDDPLKRALVLELTYHVLIGFSRQDSSAGVLFQRICSRNFQLTELVLKRFQGREVSIF